MAKKIEVLIVKPGTGTAPQLARVEDTIAAFEKIVGGPVETGCILPQRVMLFYNGEENSRERDASRSPESEWGKAPLNSLSGTLLLCGCDGNRFASLSSSQKSEFRRCFAR